MSDAAPTAALARRRGPPWRAALVVVLIGIGAGAALLGAWWLRRSPAPPDVDLTGVDPAIAQAIDHARADVRSGPRSAAAWGHLGMVLRAHDFAAEANVCFAEAETLDASDPRWPYLHGLTVALTDRDGAIPLLQRAADRSRADPTPRLRLAEVLLQQGQLDEAERHFRRITNNASAAVRAHLGLARITQQRGALQDAITHLEPVVTSMLVRKAGLTLRAEVYEQLGAVNETRADLAQAAAQPDDPPWPDAMVEEVERLKVGVEARLVLAEQLFRQARAGESLELLEQIAQAEPQSDSVFLALGHTLLRMQQPARAESALRRAVALAPAAAEAHFQLGNALFLQQRIASAADSFRTAIRCNAAHALAHYNLAHCLMRQDDRAGAIAEFRQTLRYRPNYAEAHTNLGDLLAHSGKRAEAMEHLENAVRLAPTDEGARKLLAEARARKE